MSATAYRSAFAAAQSRSLWRWGFAALFSALTLVATRSVAHAEDAISEAELKSNWASVDQLERRARSYVLTLSLPNEPAFAPAQTKLAIGSDRWLASVDYRGKKSLFVKSPQYVFLLWQEPKATGWVLRACETAPEAKSNFERSVTFLRDSRPIGTLYTVSQRGETRDPTVYEYSQKPSFKIQRITRQSDGQDKVEFTCEDSVGWLLTDRSKSSAVTRSEIRVGKFTPTTYPVVVELKQRVIERVGDELVCRKSEHLTRHGTTDKVLQHELIEYSDYSFESPPEEMFTLAHYGMPEPVDVAPPPAPRTPRYVWFLAAAVGFAVLAVAFRWLTRRRNPPPAPEGTA